MTADLYLMDVDSPQRVDSIKTLTESEINRGKTTECYSYSTSPFETMLYSTWTFLQLLQFQ